MASVEDAAIQPPKRSSETGERWDSGLSSSPEADASGHSSCRRMAAETAIDGTSLGFLEPELLSAGSSRVRVAVRIRGYPPDAPPPPQTVVLRMLNDETLQLSRPAGFSASAAAAAAAAAAGNYLGSSSVVRWGTLPRNAGGCNGSTPCYLSSQKEWTQEYSFDRVFGPAATQEEVYVKTTQFMLPHVIHDGVHATVFAYGATGAGKTHTMLGTDQQPGIMRRAVQDIFFLLEQLKRFGKGSAPTACTRAARGLHPKGRCEACPGCAIHQSSTVHVSYLEVYNERIRDLLDPSRVSLEVQEDSGKVRVSNLSEHPVTGPEDALALLAQGNKNRCCAATAANSTSSRSHAIFQLVVKSEWLSKTKGTFAKTEAKLSLIDLAGSERASATVNRGHRLQEGCHINQSLLALANCINALHLRQQMERVASGASGKAVKCPAGSPKPDAVPASGLSAMSGPVFVNYRNSKLTHLLKSSLEGHCLVVMIANVHFTASAYAESNNTLKYANRAKNLRVNAAGLRGAGLVGATSTSQDKARLLRLVHEQAQQLKEEQEKSLSLEQKLEAAQQENQGLRQELQRKDLQVEKLLRRYQELKKARNQGPCAPEATKENRDSNTRSSSKDGCSTCSPKDHECLSDRGNAGDVCMSSSTPKRQFITRPDSLQGCAYFTSSNGETGDELALSANVQCPVKCSGNFVETSPASTPLRSCAGGTRSRRNGETESVSFQSVDSKRPSRQLRSAERSRTRRAGVYSLKTTGENSEASPGVEGAYPIGCPARPPSPSSASLRRSLRLASLPERRTYEAQCSCCAGWRGDDQRASEATLRRQDRENVGHPQEHDTKSEPSISLRRGVDKSLSVTSPTPLSARRERKRGASCCDSTLFTTAVPAPATSGIPPTSPSPAEASDKQTLAPAELPLLYGLRTPPKDLSFDCPEYPRGEGGAGAHARCHRKEAPGSQEDSGGLRSVDLEAAATTVGESPGKCAEAETLLRRGSRLPRTGSRGAGGVGGRKAIGTTGRGRAPISAHAAPACASSLSSRGGRKGVLPSKEPNKNCRIGTLLKEAAKGPTSRGATPVGGPRHQARSADRRRGNSRERRGDASLYWRAPGEARQAAEEKGQLHAESSSKDKISLHPAMRSSADVETSRELRVLRSDFGWQSREKKRRRTRDMSAASSTTAEARSLLRAQMATNESLSRCRTKRVTGEGAVRNPSCVRAETTMGEVCLPRSIESLARGKVLQEPTGLEVSTTREPSVMSDTWSFASESSFTKPMQSRHSLCENESGASAEASSAAEGPTSSAARDRPLLTAERQSQVCHRSTGAGTAHSHTATRRPNRSADVSSNSRMENLQIPVCSSSDRSEAFRKTSRSACGRIKRPDTAGCSIPTTPLLEAGVTGGLAMKEGDKLISSPSGDGGKSVKPCGLGASFGCLNSRSTLQSGAGSTSR
ncbi:UNVERIFIED_CONTAM: kinesin motor domain-containing protein [Hammondia hammondi]|eukprot:XP_008883917.1 kinesin motor domain-containing protein [Hammondia hammondi]